MPYNVKQVPQFEALRQRQQNRQQANIGQADDALKRRFAAMGATNSGAMVKAQQNMLDGAARQNEEATQGIDFAEAQESSRQGERADDVGFRDKQFDFQKSEALENRKTQQSQFDRSLALQNQQFGMDYQAQDFNMNMAREQKEKGGLISKGVNAIMNPIGGLTGGGGGTFFCTELFMRGLCTREELDKMSQFFLKCLWTDASTCYFYALNAPKIVAAANRSGFDWSSVKKRLIDDIIENMESGQIEISKLLYKYNIFSLCLRFEETRDLYEPRSLETTMLDRIITIPRILFTQSFQIAFRKSLRKLLTPKRVKQCQL